MKARPVFWFALLFTLFMVPIGTSIAQNAFATIAFTAPANTTTEIIGPGGAFPNTPYGISTFVYSTTGVMTAGAQFSLMQGSVSKDTPPCNTNRVLLTGALPVAYSGTPTTGTQNAPSNPGVLAGAPVITVAGSSVMCVAFTATSGTSLTGFATLNR